MANLTKENSINHPANREIPPWMSVQVVSFPFLSRKASQRPITSSYNWSQYFSTVQVRFRSGREKTLPSRHWAETSGHEDDILLSHVLEARVQRNALKWLEFILGEWIQWAVVTSGTSTTRLHYPGFVELHKEKFSPSVSFTYLYVVTRWTIQGTSTWDITLP